MSMRADKTNTAIYRVEHRAARIALCLTLGVLILLFSVLFRQKAGIDTPFSLTQATAVPTSALTPVPDRSERTLHLSERTWYALQLGAFTQESSARQLAQEYIARGAAGYVHADASAYRVLAAAYPTRADAQSVQTRLAAQNVSTYIHVCTQPALSLRAGGTKAQLDALEDVLSHLDALGNQLYTLFLALDTHEMDASSARAALASEGVTCSALHKRLLSAFGGQLPASLTPLSEMLTAIAQEGSAIETEESAARTGAALKRCHLIAAAGLKDFAAALQP